MPQKPRHQKTAMQRWVMDNRKRLTETSADLARLTGVTTDTARGWESRGSPSEEAIAVLERHFGVARPNTEAPTSDTAGASALLLAVTQLIEQMTEDRKVTLELLRLAQATADRAAENSARIVALEAQLGLPAPGGSGELGAPPTHRASVG